MGGVQVGRGGGRAKGGGVSVLSMGGDRERLLSKVF